MRQSDLIKEDLGGDAWGESSLQTSPTGELRVAVAISPFPSSKTYIVHGKPGKFDFPTLPHSSYCVYIADGRKAVRLTRTGKEIETVLKENWNTLADCDPVPLASLILMFFDGGIKSTHDVLPDEDALLAYSRSCVFDDQELEKSREFIGTTCVSRSDDTVVLRAVTLCGWMHRKQNLGIERIHISKSGVVHLEKREVLSEKIFTSVPAIRY